MFKIIHLYNERVQICNKYVYGERSKNNLQVPVKGLRNLHPLVKEHRTRKNYGILIKLKKDNISTALFGTCTV